MVDPQHVKLPRCTAGDKHICASRPILQTLCIHSCTRRPQEWFFPWGAGSVRMYAGKTSKTYKPGQVPGFNAPVTVAGSASIKKGNILYSPVGVVHYFSAEDEGVYNFIQVHAYGECLQACCRLTGAACAALVNVFLHCHTL
jgi:hypothetical protein